MLKTLRYFVSIPILLIFGFAATAQSPDYRAQLQTLVKKEGEVFIAMEYMHPEQQKKCRMEDLFTNTLAFRKDTLVIDYDNYTESFCEIIKLETQLTYHVRIQDIDPFKIILMQRKYNLKSNTLLEGQSSWYELQINTKAARMLARERNLEDQPQKVNKFRIIFKTQEGAKRALTALRELTKSNS